ncbi:MarR family transcriptional regulator [Clostridium chromiireducens]|uniref:MarR family transcriptional regulator n=1 Tax=Clostridium chromiireducens TaxID=225345 RepID=A0A399IKF0_9CLOT|nr:MarR family transcriptional regulator [Clostridium chromiireducens]RII32739.1 MarR family transcriptional regulator [Clostridium chromiireducens]
MDKDNLFKVADSLVNFLWIIKKYVLKENDIAKNFQSPEKVIEGCIPDFSIPPSHIKVIFYLAEFNSSPISQIAENLNISKSNMTPIIDNLISHGLVNRYSDSNDRRILRVELTKKTFDLLDSFRVAICNSFVDKISELSDDEISTLDESISNLITIIRKLK